MPDSSPAIPGAAARPGHMDAIIIGAGFSGLYQLHALRQTDLQQFSKLILEWSIDVTIHGLLLKV